VSNLRLPDFIIGGAPRSGTTWLYQLADRHPAIAMAKPLQPEPKFFLVDALFERGLEFYASTWFEQLPLGCVLGEKSTNYLEGVNVAERIRRMLPNVRLVFLLRNPVNRAWSNYLWSRRNGMEMMSFKEALALEDKRERELPLNLRYARPHAYFSRGLYAQHLARFYRWFPRDRILVLQTEDIGNAPGTVAERFQQFVKVPVIPDLAKGLGPVNASIPEEAADLSADIRAELEDRYSEPNRQLAALLGTESLMWPTAQP
jgi:hypothetical protein